MTIWKLYNENKDMIAKIKEIESINTHKIDMFKKLHSTLIKVQ